MVIYTIDKRESNRITCLRALCVVLVIFLHQYAGALGDTAFVATGTVVSNQTLEAIQYIISRIVTFAAVPLFFLISSVLLYAKEFTWKSNMKKKLKSLIFPYVLWITIYILIYCIGQTIPATALYFANAKRQVREMAICDFIGAYTGVGGNGIFVNALWFLRDLIILNFIAPMIKILIDRFPRLVFILLMILWNMGHVPGILILNTQSIVFFCLGYYVVKYGIRMKLLDKLSVRGGVFYISF
ncbi:MAG: acyltransferase family protein [Eubacteriales bacterium]|nr:acyltransferase family protein [Eubacteriales bacterium]